MDYKSALATERGQAPTGDKELLLLLRHNPPKALVRPDIDMRRARLADVIAGEIVPRLKTMHHGIRSHIQIEELPNETEIAEFGELVMSPDISKASLYFDQMRDKGYSLDTLFVHFLEPTARHLGELWNQDRCDFVDVTIGVAHMQELLSVFGAKDNIPARDVYHRVLLLTTPTEKHVFGVDMVGSFMREAGWDVIVAANMSVKESTDYAARDWYGVVGLTLSNDKGLETAAKIIEAVKKVSKNKSVPVMVGGPVFTHDPELAIQIGADAAAADAPTAVVLAKKLLLAHAAQR
jgi:methanogenic corrinoid protein MtbC1